MSCKAEENRPNYFKIYLESRGMYNRDFYPALREVWEDAKLGKYPGPTTVNDWINDARPWKLTHGQWMAVAGLLHLTDYELNVLMSGRFGNKTYTQEEIDQVMKKRLPITDPGFDLRYLIDSAGLTQTGFAKKLGVDVTTVQKWCAGSSEARLNPRKNHEARKLLKCNDIEFIVATENAQPARLSAYREKKLKEAA